MDVSYLKNEYGYVSFGIHTPGYFDPGTGRLGFEETESIAFYSDCERVFSAAGWTIENGYAVNGKSSLHLHPQQFLGFVHSELIDKVMDIIACGTIFNSSHCDMRIIDKAYDVTAEQEHEHIMLNRAKVETELLEIFQTKRRNLFCVPGYQLWTRIELPLGKKYGIPAIDEKVNNAAGNVVGEILSSLICEGKIHKTIIKGHDAYRTVLRKTSVTSSSKDTLPPDTFDLFH